jgi:hypothetical protein
MKTIHYTTENVENAKREGFFYGKHWINDELGLMIDLFKSPVKGSKKL